MKRLLNLKEVNAFLSKDVNRICGRIARRLALNSPWIDVIGKHFYPLLMKKTKTVTFLKGFTVIYSDQTILEKPLKIGRHTLKFSDLFPNFSGKANLKITVECIPCGKKKQNGKKGKR